MTSFQKVWQAKVYTAQANLFGTYQFANLTDALDSVHRTWAKNPNEIKEIRCADSERYLWVYSSDNARVAVEIYPIELKVLNSSTVF